jgi:hypothetical protein
LFDLSHTIHTKIKKIAVLEVLKAERKSKMNRKEAFVSKIRANMCPKMNRGISQRDQGFM